MEVLPATSTNQTETVTYATAGNYTAYLVLDGVCDGQVIDSVEVVITIWTNNYCNNYRPRLCWK